MTRVWEKIERLKKLPGLSHLRFRHAPPPRLPVAGLVRAGDDRGARPRPSSAPRTASSRCGARSRRSAPTRTNCRWSTRRSPTATRSCARAPYAVLADWQQDYEGNLLRHPARHLRHHELPQARARLGRRPGPASASIRRIRSRAARRRSTGGCRAARTRARSSPSSPTGSTSTRSSASTRHFHGRMRIGYGWGTLLTNDFRGLGAGRRLDPISIVCKVISADGRPAVKISDNPTKAIGPKERPRVSSGYRAGVRQSAVQTAQPVRSTC